MPESFDLSQSVYGDNADNRSKRVLVTGAAGHIGSYFAEHGQGKYDLRLMVPDEELGQKVEGFGQIILANLDDLEALKRACRGMDAVVHLAADPRPSAPWSSLRPNNIVGTYNLLVAAKSAGVKRVVFASSIHAVSGYEPDMQVKPDDPVNPGDLYGVSKAFGESMGRYMAEQEGLSVICVRIGAFTSKKRAAKHRSLSMLDAFVSKRDLNQLLQRCLDHPTLKFGIFHGLSDNRFKRMDISNARQILGYAPQDDLTQLNPDLNRLDLDHQVMTHAKKEGQRSGIREDL